MAVVNFRSNQRITNEEIRAIATTTYAVFAPAMPINVHQTKFQVTNTHDQAITVRLLGGRDGDPTMASPAIIIEQAMGAGNVTPTQLAIASNVVFKYYRIQIVTAALPTVGNINGETVVRRRR